MTSPAPWKDAWQAALYAPGGFFRATRPRDHFRTNAHIGAFAEAVAELARRIDAKTIVDMASGGGELLAALRHLLPDTSLIGVEVAHRPEGLDPSIGWMPALPDHIDGLLIANEWLDNIPCTVVEVDGQGTPREVLVDLDGNETLGNAMSDAWMERWWPLGEPGERAEIGTPRDTAWAEAVSRVDGIAVAIDYGHTRDGRPPFGSVRSFVDGIEVDVVPDGSRDVTAHVAVDSVAESSGGHLVRQRDALATLGVSGTRPALDLARTDPANYLRSLTSASEAGELLASGGLGDFWWIVTDTSGRGTLGP